MKLPVNMVSVNDRRDIKMVARTEREATGLSLREVARRMKMAPSYLSYMELGQGPWSQRQVDRFNAALKKGV
jgi:transcriptional regulator with XRE-family HTH domain